MSSFSTRADELLLPALLDRLGESLNYWQKVSGTPTKTVLTGVWTDLGDEPVEVSIGRERHNTATLIISADPNDVTYKGIASPKEGEDYVERSSQKWMVQSIEFSEGNRHRLRMIRIEIKEKAPDYRRVV